MQAKNSASKKSHFTKIRKTGIRIGKITKSPNSHGSAATEGGVEVAKLIHSYYRFRL